MKGKVSINDDTTSMNSTILSINGNRISNDFLCTQSITLVNLESPCVAVLHFVNTQKSSRYFFSF